MMYLEALVVIVMVAHILVSPYTKVEESFNTQAVHDLLYHGTNLSQYDHLEFPGVVPRSFVGPLVISALSAPIAAIIHVLQLNKLWVQVAVRCVLGMTVALGMFTFAHAVQATFGRRVRQLLLVITATQFHFVFYMSRTLPNVFALSLVLLALSFWLRRRHVQFVWCGAAAIILFRAELALYLGLILLLDLATRRVSLTTLLTATIPAGVVILGLTVAVDSYFWQRWLWPEGEVLWFNVVLNKSSQWGTLPFLWYFYSALPRALSCSVLLVPLGLYMSAPVRHLLAPALVFVLLYSALPHKELRFIIYVVPVCNIAVAYTVNRLWQTRNKGVFPRLLCWAALLHLLGNLATTAVFTYISHHNYPGGHALYRLHQLEPQNTAVHVHIDVATAQTGVTRFSQQYPHWIYNKTENLPPGGVDMMSYTHLLLGNQSLLDIYQDSHIVLNTVNGFDRISVNRNEFPFISFTTVPKIWTLKRIL